MTDIRFEEIETGKSFSFERTLSKDDVAVFARLTGDKNPHHVDESFGKASVFKANIVHGMLAGGLFSTLVGMHCPGQNCLYLTQSLNFRKPLRPGCLVLVQGEVISKIDSLRILVIKTRITCCGELAIDGEARVKLI